MNFPKRPNYNLPIIGTLKKKIVSTFLQWRFTYAREQSMKP